MKIHTDEIIFEQITAKFLQDMDDEMNMGNLKIRLAESKVPVLNKGERMKILEKYHEQLNPCTHVQTHLLIHSIK